MLAFIRMACIGPGCIRTSYTPALFPEVLEMHRLSGGDCSILLGTLLGAGRRGRTGLAFVDGHIDFYPPENNQWNGVGTASELAFTAGRGPA